MTKKIKNISKILFTIISFMSRILCSESSNMLSLWLRQEKLNASFERNEMEELIIKWLPQQGLAETKKIYRVAPDYCIKEAYTAQTLDGAIYTATCDFWGSCYGRLKKGRLIKEAPNPKRLFALMRYIHHKQIEYPDIIKELNVKKESTVKKSIQQDEYRFSSRSSLALMFGIISATIIFKFLEITHNARNDHHLQMHVL